MLSLHQYQIPDCYVASYYAWPMIRWSVQHKVQPSKLYPGDVVTQETHSNPQKLFFRTLFVLPQNIYSNSILKRHLISQKFRVFKKSNRSLMSHQNFFLSFTRRAILFQSRNDSSFSQAFSQFPIDVWSQHGTYLIIS